jgi:PIN domain nuclease of toxin-antitoxin system
MKYLLDTHILLWFAENSKRLSSEFREIISDVENEICVSVASVWEVVIKQASKKIELKSSIEEIIKRYKFPVLDIKMEHVLEIAKLPNIHKDPFDRMIVAQTKVEDLVLLTSDKTVKKYFKD